nr:hypothetical protein [Tanacetum cinerariifolium]
GISLTQQWKPFFTSSGKELWQWELLYWQGISLTQQWEPFFTSSGKELWQWELLYWQ